MSNSILEKVKASVSGFTNGVHKGFSLDEEGQLAEVMNQVAKDAEVKRSIASSGVAVDEDKLSDYQDLLTRRTSAFEKGMGIASTIRREIIKARNP